MKMSVLRERKKIMNANIEVNSPAQSTCNTPGTLHILGDTAFWIESNPT